MVPDPRRKSSGLRRRDRVPRIRTEEVSTPDEGTWVHGTVPTEEPLRPVHRRQSFYSGVHSTLFKDLHLEDPNFFSATEKNRTGRQGSNANFAVPNPTPVPPRGSDHASDFYHDRTHLFFHVPGLHRTPTLLGGRRELLGGNTPSSSSPLLLAGVPRHHPFGSSDTHGSPPLTDRTLPPRRPLRPSSGEVPRGSHAVGTRPSGGYTVKDPPNVVTK